MLISPYNQRYTYVVLQRDHSEIAGKLAAHWGNETFARPAPYRSVVLAAHEHDKDWDWENQPTLGEDGQPIDYIGSAGGAQGWPGWYERLVEHVVSQEPYAGLLVSLHGVGLVNGGYGVLTHMPDKRAVSPNREFIAGQERRQQQLLEELRRTGSYGEAAGEEQVWRNYRLLQVFDRLAQVLCNRYPLNSTARKNGPPLTLGSVPVAPGQDDTTLTIEMVDDRRAIFRPYPFDVDPLEIKLLARLIPVQQYASQDAYFEAFYQAKRLVVEYTLTAG